MKKGTILFDDILTTIGEDAFKDCENLTSITLPKKVNGILANAFQNCVNLNEINYNGNSSDFKKIKFEANWNDNIPAEYANCSDSKVRIKYNYLTFTALEDNCSIGFYNNPNSSVNPTIEYSFDKNTWRTLTDNITIENGSKMYCRGLNPNGISGGYGEDGYNYFTGEGKFNVSGDIMSLIDYKTMPETMVGTFYNLFGGNVDTSRDNFVDIVDASNLILSAKTLTDDCYANMFDSCSSMVYGPQIESEILTPYCYYKMFYNCTSLTSVPNLPATTLERECYTYMFYNCSSLTTAPELPATTLAYNCYHSMFESCISLTTAPELPATVLANYCYSSMFGNCSSLTTAPELPATVLAEGCYISMFGNCSSLTAAPELPATVLANYCYDSMFIGCKSLTTAPELPATTLAKRCYYSMFWNCTSLTTAPELPATTLADYCYYSMFGNCSSLTAAPELPATKLADYCYNGMFSGCTSLTAAPELSATTLAERCYQYMFNNCTKLNYIKCLATDISDTKCTVGWVSGVSSTGTFVKYPGMNSWSTGVNGIPEGWVVEDVEIPCVTFTAEMDNSLIDLNKLSTNQTLEYSTDTNTWNTFDTTTNISLNSGDKVYVRGILSADNTSSNYTQFKMSGKIAASGNCNAIWNYQDLNAPLKAYCGYYMFQDCTSLTAAPELPATVLAEGCYISMFGNCSSLTAAPELPATMLAYACYGDMFYGCTSLTTAPELPATTLAEGCYQHMFYDCTKLNYIKCLATDISATDCTEGWVYGVSSTGTFIKHPDMNNWTTGNSGIPSGWTVEDAS